MTVILKKIEVRRFKGLAELDLELGPGLNVARGPNESGKSTIIEAILAAFYSSPTSRSQASIEMISWGQEQAPFLALDLEVDGKPARLEKDFSKRDVAIFEDGQTIKTAKAVKEWTAHNLGPATRELFVATACLTEESFAIPRITGQDPRGREIMDRLQATLTGAPGGSPAQVIKRLRERHRAIGKKPGVNDRQGGPLTAARNEIGEADRKIQALRLNLEEYEKAEDRLTGVAERLSALETRMGDLDSALQNHLALIESEDRITEIKAALDRLLKAEALAGELKQMEEEMKAFPGFDDLGPAAKRLAEIVALLDEMDKHISSLEYEKIQAAIKPPAYNPILAAAALILLASGTVAALSLKSAWPLLAAGAALPLAGLAAYFKFSSSSRESKRLAAIAQEMESLVSRRDEMEREQRSIEERFGKRGARECLESWSTFHEMRRRMDSLIERISDLAGPDGLNKGITDLSLAVRTEMERAKSLEPYRVKDPSRLAALEREAREAREEIGRLREDRVRTEARKTSLDFDPEELIELEEGRAELSRRVEYWERTERVHAKALAMMEESVEAVLARAGELIEKEMNPLMAAVTSGRYEKVRAGHDLALSVLDGKSGRWVDERFLSLATREQLHLAARLSLVNLILGKARPPVILDDPFAHYDDERAKKALAVIKEFARGRQVILFTPSRRREVAADLVARLERIE